MVVGEFRTGNHRVKVHRKLSEGGLATVWKGELAGRSVAVRFMKPEFHDHWSEHFYGNATNARILKKKNLPVVNHLMAGVTNGNLHFQVMELCQGTLCDIFSRNKHRYHWLKKQRKKVNKMLNIKCMFIIVLLLT